jgi:hypothetical protein
MTARQIETRLAYVSFGVLAIYAPVETIYSWPGGLGSPYYIVDVIAIGLIFGGALRSLRARPGTAPGLLTAGWAWGGANFWRAAFDRIAKVEAGGHLGLGSVELQFVCAELVVALICLAVGIVLVIRSRDGP